MRRRQLLALRCERARQLGSVRLDGPLSELDQAYLEGHLDGCPDCAHVVGGMTRLTGRVRGEPLRQAPRWAAAVALAPRPTRRRRAGMFAGVAAAAAAAAAMGAFVASPWHQPAPSRSGPSVIRIAQARTPPPWQPIRAGSKHRSGQPH